MKGKVPFEFWPIIRNLILEDPGRPLREHAAGVTPFLGISAPMRLRH